MSSIDLRYISFSNERAAQQGFTLVEMLVVVAIAGLAILGLAVAARPIREWATLVRFERQLIDYANRARSVALRDGKPVRLGISMQHRLVTVEGWPRHLAVPATLDISMTSAREAGGADEQAIVFLPDGTCSGGSIRIGWTGRDRTEDRRLRVLWATSLVARED